ncbi:5-oxoprolinase subunit PxpA [Hydrogenovibrio kuenenii]|uniref:5-oxoprolinase subunit PxpA n=1 Tax=Hydrogenovibrio kuenenii TaxID=63658 RepID=UPI0004B97582|nr:5-oxoprolinase subunit PxpA [Hydrogenovibrio kuenenii]
MILINCDMGENLTPNPDALVMPHIHLANIACGGHAGDATSIMETLALAKQHSVKIGAHPSYPDKDNFGRQSQSLSEAALHQTLTEQVSALENLASSLGLQLHHIKPHGALYLDMMRSEQIFLQLLSFCQAFNQGKAQPIKLMIQGGLKDKDYQTLADTYSIELLFEAFADRAYLPNGQLAPRSQPNSLYQHTDNIIEQSWQFHKTHQQASTPNTLCFHSDNPVSVDALIAFAKELKESS